MKKIEITLIICVLFAFSGTTHAQVDGEYRQVPGLDKYVGTWQWMSGDSVFTIKLAKTILNFKQYTQQYEVDGPNATVDVLIGWHEFKIGATVKQSSMNSENSMFDYNNENQTIIMWLVSGMDYEDKPYEFLRVGFFRDINEEIIIRQGTFRPPDNNHAFLVIIGDKEGKFSLPKKVLMTKIE